MNVLYTSNDGYARHLGVLLYPLLEHHRDTESTTIYLLSVNMSVESQGRSQEIAGRFGQKLMAVEMGDLKEQFHGSADTRGFDVSTMTRLSTADVLPETVDKILYLDCGTVILGNLEPLWQMEFGTALVGMVPEPTVHEEMEISIDLEKDAPYYSPGVLLMNLEGWQEEGVSEKLLTYYAAKGGNLSARDQDTLGGVLRGRIVALSPKYDFLANYRYFRYGTLAELNASYKVVGKQEYEAARRHPVIIHYVGDERPWVAGNRNRYWKYYEIHLSRTPWEGTPKETGKEPYMMVYQGMNHVTWLCLPVRMWISRRFGMKMIDSRKKERKR